MDAESRVIPEACMNALVAIHLGKPVSDGFAIDYLRYLGLVTGSCRLTDEVTAMVVDELIKRRLRGETITSND